MVESARRLHTYRDRFVKDEPKPQMGILRVFHPWHGAETTELMERFFSYDCAPGRHIGDERNDEVWRGSGRDSRDAVGEPPPAPERCSRPSARKVSIAHDRCSGAPTLKGFECVFKKVGEPLIIRVEKSEYIAARFCRAPIAGCTRSPVRLRDDAEAAIAYRARSGNAAVGRTVVHDDDFEVGHRLRFDRAERASDITLLVVEGNND
jgi:hypothetical protein